jgi:hypothetical protein
MKINIVLLIVFLATRIYAQPLFLSSNMKYNVGEQYIYHISDSLYPIVGNGTPLAWDFSQLPSGTTQIVSIFNNTNAAFPNAQIEYSTAQEKIYYDQSADQIDLVGRVATYTFTCTDPQTILKFPMTHFDTLLDSWNCSFANGTSQFFRYGNRSAKGNWYGKIFTPINQYNQVIRVDVKDYFKDSLIGVASFLSYENDYTLFYQEGIALPVIIRSDLNTLTVSKVGKTAYLQAIITSLENSEHGDFAQVTTYPNPATEYIDVQIPQVNVDQFSITITDLYGRSIPVRNHKVNQDIVRIQPQYSIHGYHMINISVADKIIVSRKIYFQ